MIPNSSGQLAELIKSTRYTGGDFMFLYWFVRRRPQILVHAITFEQLFGFLSFLARLLALTCRIPDYILGDFRPDLDQDFCWGLAILCDPPFFSGYIEFGGVVVKFYSSVEVTLYLLADFLLQYVTLLQYRDIVKNLVSL